MVTARERAMADRLSLLRAHGTRKKYHSEMIGMNSRLDALQAAILRVKIRYLDTWTNGRQDRAARYAKNFLTNMVSPRSSSSPARHPTVAMSTTSTSFDLMIAIDCAITSRNKAYPRLFIIPNHFICSPRLVISDTKKGRCPSPKRPLPQLFGVTDLSGTSSRRSRTGCQHHR